MSQFQVVEIKIAPPHERRVMAVDLSEMEAGAFIKLAVMRRGVEQQFYRAEPIGDGEQGRPPKLDTQEG